VPGRIHKTLGQSPQEAFGAQPINSGQSSIAGPCHCTDHRARIVSHTFLRTLSAICEHKASCVLNQTGESQPGL